MPRQIKPVEIKPGKLMTGVSADTAGISNYTIKRDFRRVLERDIRAEGYEWFRPNATYDKIIQSIPLVTLASVVVLTNLTNPIFNGTYVLNPATGIYVSGVNSISPPNNPPFTVLPGLWVLASGRNTNSQVVDSSSQTLISSTWEPSVATVPNPTGPVYLSASPEQITAADTTGSPVNVAFIYSFTRSDANFQVGQIVRVSGGGFQCTIQIDSVTPIGGIAGAISGVQQNYPGDNFVAGAHMPVGSTITFLKSNAGGNSTAYATAQNTTPITVIAETQLGNGRIAIVAGTPTTLWRYVGLEDPNYFDSEGGLNYFDTEGMTVTGAGISGVNGQYSESSADIGGKPQYSHGNYLLGWDNIRNLWVFYDIAQGVSVYASASNTATPDIATGWFSTDNSYTPNSLNNPVPSFQNPTTYFNDGPEGWLQIGSGFSTAGNRWEAVGVNGYLVLNNGVDLPMTYNLQESAVKPIYELREQGVACVGTIAAQDGILCCMDISQIDDAALLQLMSPIAAAVNAARDSTGLITPTAATLFPSIPVGSLVGLTLFWSNGSTSLITSLDSSGFLHTLDSQPVNDSLGNPPFTSSWTPTYAAPVIASQPVAVENSAAYAIYNDTDNIQRIRYRFFPSMPSQPRRFGSQIPVSMQAGSRIATLLFPVRSIPELVSGGVQSSFVITGVALGNGNLTANVIATTPVITQTLLLDETCMTEQDFGTTAEFGNPLLNSIALIEAADAAASFAGIFEDLEDDGGGIIKALTLQGQLVIYKETPVIFLAAYTGDLKTPFQFQRIPIQAEAAALRYRNTLIAGGGGFYGSYHFYAGKNAFFKFDMFTQTPVEIPLLQPCSNIFFENASDTENAFCCENPLTREIFIVFPNQFNSPDSAICYDVAYQSVRTTAVPLSALGKVRHPVTRDYWFAMGLTNGSVKRYGKFAAPFQSSGSITATLAAGVATSSASFFNPSHVGMTIQFAGGVNVAVAEYVSPTVVAVYADPSLPAPAISTGQLFLMNPSIWHWDGQAYPSTLQSGLDSFGLTHGEKMLNEYVLSLSSKSPNTPATVTFLGAVNGGSEIIASQAATIKSPAKQNLVKPTLMQYYIGVNVAVSGMNNPIEVTGQLFNVIPVTSHSFGRRPT